MGLEGPSARLRKKDICKPVTRTWVTNDQSTHIVSNLRKLETDSSDSQPCVEHFSSECAAATTGPWRVL